MESIVFSDNQAPEVPQADTYFMDPPGPFGYRLHVNLMLAPGIPSEYQDAVSASLHDVAELVRRNDSLRHVRLAYVGPTNDCVYLVCQGFYGGSRDLDFFVNCRHRDQDLMAEWIRQKRHDRLDCPQIQRCDFCYLSFDPGARWRPFIQDKRQKENEL
jgi:hypothetical protein